MENVDWIVYGYYLASSYTRRSGPSLCVSPCLADTRRGLKSQLCSRTRVCDGRMMAIMCRGSIQIEQRLENGAQLRRNCMSKRVEGEALKMRL